MVVVDVVYKCRMNRSIHPSSMNNIMTNLDTLISTHLQFQRLYLPPQTKNEEI